MITPHGDFRVYTLEPKGGIPSLIPLEPCAWVSYEPRGKRMAMQKMGLEFHNWKRYKGGEAEKIYVGTLAPLSFVEVTQVRWEERIPDVGEGWKGVLRDRSLGPPEPRVDECPTAET